MWVEGQHEYSFGELQAFTTKKEDKNRTEMKFLQHVVSEDWRDKISLSKGSEQIWNAENVRSERDYGNLMHTALSRILCKEDIKTALNSMQAEGLLLSQDVNLVEVKLTQLLSKPEIASFFEKGLTVKTEAEILLPQGKSYRPDRVVFYAEKAVVLDYKTGIELQKHKSQISSYAETLVKMGFPRVEKYLLYTETEKLLIV